MYDLIAKLNSPQNTRENFSKSKNKEQTQSKDFANILTNEEQRQSTEKPINKGLNALLKNGQTVKNNAMEGKEDVKSNEEYQLIEGPLDENGVLLNALFNLLINLDSLIEEYGETDQGEFYSAVEELIAESDIFLNKEEIQVHKEDYEDICKIFESIVELQSTCQGNPNISKEWLLEKYSSIKDKTNQIRNIVLRNAQNTQGITQDFDTTKASLDLNDEEGVKVEIIPANKEEHKDLFELKETEGAMKLDIMDDTELDTPVFQINNSFVFVQNDEIQTTKPYEIDPKVIFEQVTEKIKLTIDGSKQQIRIRLKPEILGELLLKLETEKGVMSAKILVDNYRTKEVIENNLYQFRENIRQSGLNIKTFEVLVGNNEDFERESNQGFQFNKKQTKLKVRNRGIKEIQFYNHITTNIIHEITGYGGLDLFA